MAAPIHPQQTGIPSPSPSSSRRSATPAGPKLRDSCDACASSKVKCHKEKPTCSRCAKRGLVCEYVATRRGGRTNHGRRSTVSDGGGNTSARTRTGVSPGTITGTTNAKHALPPVGGWFAPDPVVAIDYMSSPAILDASPRPSPFSTLSSLFPGIPSVDAALSTTPPELYAADLDEFFATPTSFAVTDPSNPGPDTAAFLSSGPDSRSSSSTTTFLDTFNFFEDNLSEGYVPLDIPTPPTTSTSTIYASPSSHEQQQPQQVKHQLPQLPFPDYSNAINTDWCCLAQAIVSMRQLFRNPARPCSTASSTSQKLSDDADQGEVSDLPTIQTVLSTNRRTISAITTMLDCSCSNDAYLLCIMSLIVFKVLRWYAAAAATPGLATSATTDSSRSTDSYRKHTKRYPLQEKAHRTPEAVAAYRLDDEQSVHLGAHMVLRELHRVQRVVNVLSARLGRSTSTSTGIPAVSAKCFSGKETQGDEDVEAKGEGEGGEEEEMVSPFSGAILRHIGADLKKRLRALSAQIVDGLTKE